MCSKSRYLCLRINSIFLLITLIPCQNYAPVVLTSSSSQDITAAQKRSVLSTFTVGSYQLPLGSSTFLVGSLQVQFWTFTLQTYTLNYLLPYSVHSISYLLYIFQKQANLVDFIVFVVFGSQKCMSQCVVLFS